MSLGLAPISKEHPDLLHGTVGPLHVHVTILDDCGKDADVEWYITGNPDRGDWRDALFEGYADTLDEAKEAIMTRLSALREDLNVALGTAR